VSPTEFAFVVFVSLIVNNNLLLYMKYMAMVNVESSCLFRWTCKCGWLVPKGSCPASVLLSDEPGEFLHCCIYCCYYDCLCMLSFAGLIVIVLVVIFCRLNCNCNHNIFMMFS